jgi:hypothetical protein
MSGLLRRVKSLLWGVDTGVNGLGGGKEAETLSGTFGRAAKAGAWWAPLFVGPVDAGAYLITGQRDHCARQAEIEDQARAKPGA